MLHSHEFMIDDFAFASSAMDDEQEALLRDFARTIALGAESIPPLSKVTKVVVVGHGKGTNPKVHAIGRGVVVRNRLIELLLAFGASPGDLVKLEDGPPVTVTVSSNSQVTGKDRKVTIRILWSSAKQPAPQELLARDWAKRYFAQDRLTGWKSIGSHTFMGTSFEEGGEKKVWVGPEELWKQEMRAASLGERYLENYAALLHFAPIQGVPNLVNPIKDKRDFEQEFGRRLERRIRLFEIGEFLTALYTAKPDFGSGPVLRALRNAIAPVIEQFQGTVILRISKERERPTQGLFGKAELEPIAAGGGLPVQRAMIKNAIYTATSELLAVKRGHSLKLAKSTAKNCGTIIGYAVKERNAMLRQDERLMAAALDVVAAAIGSAGGGAGAAIARSLVVAALKSQIKAASMGLDEIKTEFERQANVLEDSGANPELTNAAKTEIVQEFHDGCDTVFNP